jgi:hypothetical protein
MVQTCSVKVKDICTHKLTGKPKVDLCGNGNLSRDKHSIILRHCKVSRGLVKGIWSKDHFLSDAVPFIFREKKGCKL